MEVKSKYDVGTLIYFMNGEIPEKCTISGISFFTGKKYPSPTETFSSNAGECIIEYHVEELCRSVNEKNAYSSKEELMKSLLEKL